MSPVCLKTNKWGNKHKQKVLFFYEKMLAAFFCQMNKSQLLPFNLRIEATVGNFCAATSPHRLEVLVDFFGVGRLDNVSQHGLRTIQNEINDFTRSKCT